jgi:hypothetical protein
MKIVEKKIGIYLLCAGRLDFFEEALASIVNANTLNNPITISNNSSSKDIKISLIKLSKKYAVDYRENNPVLPDLFSHINSIVSESKHYFTCFLHDDDIIYKSYFDICLNLFEKNSDALAVACNADLIIEEKNTLQKFIDSKNGRDISFSDYADLMEGYFNFSSSFPPFPSWIYKTSALRQVSRIYTRSGIYGDVILLASVLKSGPLIVSSETGMAYRKHEGQISARTSVLNRNKFLSTLRSDSELQRRPDLIAAALYSFRVSMCLDYTRRFGPYILMSRFSPLVKWTLGQTIRKMFTDPKTVFRLVRKMLFFCYRLFLTMFKKMKNN